MNNTQGGITDEAHPHTKSSKTLKTPDTSSQVSGRRPVVVCALTQTALNEDKDNLIRFVKAPDGSYVADLKNKLPGKDFIHLKADYDTIKQATQNKLLGEQSNPDEISKNIISLLENEYYQNIALARRSGEIIFGFGKVQDLIKKNRAIFVIVAQGQEITPPFSNLPAHSFLQYGDANRYGQLFARERVVYIAFTRHHFVKRLKNLIKRMECLRISSNHAISLD